MKRSAYFLTFLSFNFYFFALQVLYCYSRNYQFIHAIPLPWHIYVELIATGIIHLVLYTLLSLAQTMMLVNILAVKKSLVAERWLIIVWSLSLSLLLCVNSYYFPLSAFGKLFSLPSIYLYPLMLVSALLLILLLLPTMYHHWILTLTVVISTYVFYTWQQPLTAPSKTASPNVIILGIDSLSPKSINSKNMPFLHQLLNQSVYFTDTISPLARTYPAWSSILTGLTVSHHHAEENLVPRRLVNSRASIAWIVRQAGYHTVFATDDRRFNSISTDFGFNTVIGPKMGVNDFILGAFNDFPLSNLLLQFKISKWLFPYNYSNRASFFSYYPDTFTQELIDQLSSPSFKKPCF